MLRSLHQLSGFFFSLLGASFFVAYVLLKNRLWMTESAVWMQIADLPLVFSAIVYGGLSLYLSLRHPEHPATSLPWLIGTPLALFFGVILVMNFWPY